MKLVRIISIVLGVVVCVIAIIYKVSWYQQPRVIFMDVGQGDAILITQGNQQMLIDAGRDASVLRGLSRFMPPWDRSIELAVATHPDSDHVGGFVSIQERYQIVSLLVSDSPGSTDLYDGILATAQEMGATITVAQTGMSIRGPFWHGTVLWPDAQVPTGGDTNDRSIVMKLDAQLRDGTTSFLLTGDASRLVESYLLHHHPVSDIDVDILKLGHHGSNTSSGESFVRTTTSREAIISAGCHNSYGHPSPEVISLLQTIQLAYRSTCTSHDVVFR